MSGHQVFNEIGFYPKFIEDLKGASGLILIQSPFVSIRGVERMGEHLEKAIARGVRVCVFLAKPRDWNNPDPKLQAKFMATKGALEMLRLLGAHTNLRTKIHEKLATVDDLISWEGSLNILSHYDTRERMTRWVSRDKMSEIVNTHKLFCDTCAANASLRIFPGGDLSVEARLHMISRFVRSRRAAIGLTQRKLAERLGIQQRTLARVESGSNNVTAATLIQIMIGLDMELAPVPRYILPSIEALVSRTPPTAK